MGLEGPFFLGPKKMKKNLNNSTKNKATATKKNTQFVDNVIAQSVKIKYIRVTFKKRGRFDPNPLKHVILFYYKFCEKNVFKTYIGRFRIKI